MRRINLLISFVLFALGVSAQPISEQEALQKAQRFLQGKNIVSPAKARSLSRGAAGNPYKHLYVFNVEDNGGYVIVAGDSRAREILGYSDQGHLDYSQMPENMKWWLSLYDEDIASIPANMTAETRVDANKAYVAPMMSFSWHQGNPYNYYCPQGCATGCGPLAMAQMMAFHKYPSNLPALEAYTDANGHYMEALQATSIDYDNMSTYDPAILARYCGQAMQANYSTNNTGAGAERMPSVLVRKFGFDESACNAYRSAYNSQEWDDLLYKELSEGRPFILSGLQDGNPNIGHGFICHGYSQGYYAVNWGWGGDQNGWYAMHALRTTNGDFSTELNACIGIRPNAGGTHDCKAFSIKNMEVTSALTVNRGSAAEPFNNINVYWRIRNSLLDPAQYQPALILFTPDKKTEILRLYEAGKFEPYNVTSTTSTVSIGNQYGDGTYRISMMMLNVATQQWEECQGMTWRYIQAVISGNTITFTNYPDVDAPYEVGEYPGWYVNPDDPDDPDNPGNPDDPDNPDNPNVTVPTNDVAFEYPTIQKEYKGKDTGFTIDWTALSTTMYSYLKMDETQFFDNFWVDCFTDDYEVPSQDARYVAPYAYNNNRDGSQGVNNYDMLIFNFGDDLFGNNGKIPEGEDADYVEPEYVYIAVATFYPNYEGEGKHHLTFGIPQEEMEYLQDGMTSPVTFTRWLRFTYKSDDEGNSTSPLRYLWLKVSMEISWNSDPNAIKVVRSGDVTSEKWYDLQGRSIAKPTKKGLYIKNGQKIMIKN